MLGLLSDLLMFPLIGCVYPFNNIASTLLLERNYFMAPPEGCTLAIPWQCQSDTNVPVNCPSSVYYQPPIPINVTQSSIDCSLNQWKDDCTVSYCSRLKAGIFTASTVMSIPYFMAAVLFPVFGFFVDRYGCRAGLIALSPAILLCVHSLMAFTDINPIGLMVGQGIAYTCFSAVTWPTLAIVVDKRYLGLGYGVAFSMQNVGLTSIPLIIASIYSTSGSRYIPNVEICFCCLAFIGILNGLVLNFWDYTYNNSLLNSVAKTSSASSKPAIEEPIYSPVSLQADEDAAVDVDAISNGVHHVSGSRSISVASADFAYVDDHDE